MFDLITRNNVFLRQHFHRKDLLSVLQPHKKHLPKVPAPDHLQRQEVRRRHDTPLRLPGGVQLREVPVDGAQPRLLVLPVLGHQVVGARRRHDLEEVLAPGLGVGVGRGGGVGEVVEDDNTLLALVLLKK